MGGLGKINEPKSELVLTALAEKDLFDFVENLSTPVIAAINGFALGGGLELAMACHIRVASNNARMGLPEVSLGLIPGYGGTQRLPRLVGPGHAMRMILTGERVDAATALRIGLVEEVVPQGQARGQCAVVEGEGTVCGPDGLVTNATIRTHQ